MNEKELENIINGINREAARFPVPKEALGLMGVLDLVRKELLEEMEGEESKVTIDLLKKTTLYRLLSEYFWGKVYAANPLVDPKKHWIIQDNFIIPDPDEKTKD